MATYHVHKFRDTRAFVYLSAMQIEPPRSGSLPVTLAGGIAFPIIFHGDYYINPEASLDGFLGSVVSDLLSRDYPTLSENSGYRFVLFSDPRSYELITYVEPSAGDKVVKYIRACFDDIFRIRFYFSDSPEVGPREVSLGSIEFPAPRPILAEDILVKYRKGCDCG